MSIIPPNLDDRSFEQLLDDAKTRAAQICPEWTDWSPGSPGVALLELFAYLTETMIFRLNRLPEKAYVEFLRLMGVQLHPPSASQTVLRFTRRVSTTEATETSTDTSVQSAVAPIVIPAGTRVSTDQVGSEPAVIFVTTSAAEMRAGQNSLDVPAIHSAQIETESFIGNGLAGQCIRVARAPIVSQTQGGYDLVVGVECMREDKSNFRYREFDGRRYRIWSEVRHFGELQHNRFVYVVDRTAGTITFAPSARTFADNQNSIRTEAFGEAPGRGSGIRVWYYSGGGVRGNVAAGRLNRLIDVLDEGLDVTNPQAAVGGTDGETLANALVRGPQQLRSGDRAVTARDFERLACQFGSVSRARAATQAELWAHARPGTVEILLVPEIPESERPDGRVTLSALQARKTDREILRVTAALNDNRPMGAALELYWVDFKIVRVKARIRIFPKEDAAQIQSQIRDRLDRFISPLPTQSMPQGWQFGQALPAGRLYDEIFRVPGVEQIETLRLIEDDAPALPIQSVAADHFQPSTWHAVSASHFYRSLDDGRSWQRMSLIDVPLDSEPLDSEPLDSEPLDSEAIDSEAIDSEQWRIIRSHPGSAGYLAAVAQQGTDVISATVCYSTNCGRSWTVAVRTEFPIHDVAWIQRGGKPALLIAAACGLYELAINTGELQQVTMAGIPADTGFWSIAMTIDAQGQPVEVAVAAKADRGVWISYEGGRSRTFLPIGLHEHDIRTLTFQKNGSDLRLWAGARVVGNRPAKGCFRWDGPDEKWNQVVRGWPGDAGSCMCLIARESQLFAATHGGGVLWLDASDSSDMAWQPAQTNCGLPFGGDEHRFTPVTTLAVAPRGNLLMAGGNAGLYHSRDNGQHFERVCETERIDSIPLPRQMLFCSGEHELEVVSTSQECPGFFRQAP